MQSYPYDTMPKNKLQISSILEVILKLISMDYIIDFIITANLKGDVAQLLLAGHHLS
jgi:hypothetical protein